MVAKVSLIGLSAAAAAATAAAKARLGQNNQKNRNLWLVATLGKFPMHFLVGKVQFTSQNCKILS